MQRAHEKVARGAFAIAREDAAGSVRAVSGGGEPQDQQSRPRVAETRNRTRPIDMVAKGALFLASHLCAVFAQAWAPLARDDGAMNGVEEGSRSRPARLHQTRHASARTIGAAGLHENAF